MPDAPAFARPHPALTPAQRYHFETFGYVIVPNVLSPERCDRINAAMHRLRDELVIANDKLGGGMKAYVKNSFLAVNVPHHHFMANFYEYDDDLLAYCCDPRLVGMAEEVMGAEARILEFNAHINRKDPNADFSKPPTYGFHNGVDVPFGSHVVNGLYHCNFVKTLTALTDIGPDDGGTTVIAGSHKCLDYQAMLKLAYEDRGLIHHVVCPKGSTLLFPETLIHATGQIRSNTERAIIITGYGPRMYPRWDGSNEVSDGFTDAFKKRVPESLHTLFFGKAHWTRGQKYRTLSDAVDAKEYAPVEWTKG
jgi:ectoine hydroxylase-related dioxygenase (phytanoyl-CoA dioxygenase family)